MSSSMMQCSSTECFPNVEVQDEEERVRLWELNTIEYVEDLTAELQIGRKFNSFEEVKGLLDKLKASGHPMRVFNSQSVEDYNRKRVKAKVPLEPISSRWQFAYYAIACVYFGQPRKRSSGVRCNQRHLALGCAAKLTISYDRKFECLVLRKSTLQHNHEIGSEVIKHYASNRKLSVREQQELNEVLELRLNNKQLKDYIHTKYKKVVTLKDIQNMKLSLRK